MNDAQLMERLYESVGALQTTTADLATALGKYSDQASDAKAEMAKHGQRLDGVQLAMGSLERVIADRQRSHSDKFERIDKRIDAVNELGERRDSEMWKRMDSRLDSIDESLAKFFETQLSHNKDVVKRLTDVEAVQLEQKVDQRWTMLIGNGVSAMVGGIIAAIVATMFGGSCAHSSNEPTRQASADRRPVAGGDVAQGHGHP